MAEKKRGRPRVEVDLDDVTDLAAEGNSPDDIARVLGFSRSTLFGRKDIKEAYEKGKATLKVNLNHWQMEAAKSGSATMLIWLGRQHLGQTDRPASDEKLDTISDNLRSLADILEKPVPDRKIEEFDK